MAMALMTSSSESLRLWRSNQQVQSRRGDRWYSVRHPASAMSTSLTLASLRQVEVSASSGLMEVTGPALLSPLPGMSMVMASATSSSVRRSWPANNEPSAGEAIVVFGKAGGFTDIDVSSSSFVSSGQGFRIFGADADDYSYNVSSVGDINGDGFDDMAVGGALADGSSNGIGLAGEVTIVFGKASGPLRCRCRLSKPGFFGRGLPCLWECVFFRSVAVFGRRRQWRRLQRPHPRRREVQRQRSIFRCGLCHLWQERRLC